MHNARTEIMRIVQLVNAVMGIATTDEEMCSHHQGLQVASGRTEAFLSQDNIVCHVFRLIMKESF
jgi:hypothetical protein